MISGDDKGASKEILEVAEPVGVAALENVWHAVLGEPLTKYMYHKLFLRNPQGQLKMWTEHELLTSISPSFSASASASLASCCRTVHTRHYLHMALGFQSEGVEVALQPGEGAAAPVTWLKMGENTSSCTDS